MEIKKLLPHLSYVREEVLCLILPIQGLNQRHRVGGDALLGAGEKLPILREEGDWLLVSLRGAVGWVRRDE